MSASGEARWLVEQLDAGKMTVADVCQLLDIPQAVRVVWLDAAASDLDLGLFISKAVSFRTRVAEKFERLLAEPTLCAPRQVEVIVRKQKHGARLPVAPARL